MANPSSGIKSLETALGVLSYLAEQPGAMTLSEIARGCGLPPSNVHRYLASFANTGLVAQKGRSGRYDLGKSAMMLGLSAMARHDFVEATADGLQDLAQQTGMTVLLSVWGSSGATVVRCALGPAPTVTTIGLGTVMPLLTSATGRAFLAWAPEPATQAVKEAETRRMAKAQRAPIDFAPSKTGIAALANQIKAQGYASVDGRFIPGLVAAAAPVLDWQAEAQAVVTLFGTAAKTIAPKSSQVAALCAFCTSHSVQGPRAEKKTV